MERQKLKELENGAIKTFVMINGIEEKLTKAGAPFINVKITDGEQEMCARKFDITEADFNHKIGDVIKVELKPNPYNGIMNATIVQFRDLKKEDGVDVSEFIKLPPVSITNMYEECLNEIYSFTNEDLKKIVATIYEDNKSGLMESSGAKSIHHNLRGGLLYHSYRMMEMAKQAGNIYGLGVPGGCADPEMLIAGALIHDIGKLIELETDEFGNASYTPEGNLFGHSFLGAELIRKYGEKLGTDPEVIRQLSHIAAAHHGKQEYEAIKIPSTAEAAIIFYLDIMDSRIYIFEEANELLNEGEFAERRSIDGAYIYKPSRN